MGDGLGFIRRGIGRFQLPGINAKHKTQLVPAKGTTCTVLEQSRLSPGDHMPPQHGPGESPFFQRARRAR